MASFGTDVKDYVSSWTGRLMILGVTLLGLNAFYQRTKGPEPVFAIGADMSSIELIDGAGARTSLATGERVHLFVFYSGCGWCEQLAPEWAEWFDANSDVNVLAISRDPIADGQAYADKHEWDVEVREVAGFIQSRGASALVQRTPIIVTVGPDGSLESVAHNQADAPLNRAGLDLILRGGW